jgi:hypothetical protein
MYKEKKVILIGIILILCISSIGGYNIYSASESISTLTQEKTSLQSELSKQQTNLDLLERQFQSLQNDKIQTSTNLNDTIDELLIRESGAKYVLHDPLYWEARNFLSSDSTDKKLYDEVNFNCVNFAQEVNNNAVKKGIRCAYVKLYLVGDDHALIAFNTTDRGLVFFEPQEDYEAKNLEVGKDYYADCVIPPAGYYYENDPNMVIEGIDIIW